MMIGSDTLVVRHTDGKLDIHIIGMFAMGFIMNPTKVGDRVEKLIRDHIPKWTPDLKDATQDDVERTFGGVAMFKSEKDVPDSAISEFIGDGMYLLDLNYNELFRVSRDKNQPNELGRIPYKLISMWKRETVPFELLEVAELHAMY